MDEINETLKGLSSTLVSAAIGKDQIPVDTMTTLMKEQGKVFHRVILTLCVINGVLLAWATGIKFYLPAVITSLTAEESHAETN